MGWLRWSPDAFWGATLAEVHSGLTGYLETRGVKPPTETDGWGGVLERVRAAMREERAAARQQQQEGRQP